MGSPTCGDRNGFATTNRAGLLFDRRSGARRGNVHAAGSTGCDRRFRRRLRGRGVSVQSGSQGAISLDAERRRTSSGRVSLGNVEPLPGYYSYGAGDFKRRVNGCGSSQLRPNTMRGGGLLRSHLSTSVTRLDAQSNLADAVSGDGSVLVGRGLRVFSPHGTGQPTMVS